MHLKPVNPYLLQALKINVRRFTRVTSIQFISIHLYTYLLIHAEGGPRTSPSMHWAKVETLSTLSRPDSVLNLHIYIAGLFREPHVFLL